MIVLDTHVWFWWLSRPQRLGKKAARAIEHADRIGVPAICAWEVAVNAEAKKLRFDRPYEMWIEEALEARVLDAALVTSDGAIRESRLVRCIWD